MVLGIRLRGGREKACLQKLIAQGKTEAAIQILLQGQAVKSIKDKELHNSLLKIWKAFDLKTFTSPSKCAPS